MLKHALTTLAVAAIAVAAAVVAPAHAEAKVNVYITPGRHVVDGREWKTTCDPYDANITRCRAEIKSGGKFVFNNLAYLAADRKLWFDNTLARPGTFTSGGREWLTSCNDDWTGASACRSFIKSGSKWLFNNIVYFTPGTVDYPKFAFNQSTGKLTATGTPTTRRWAMASMPLYYAPPGGSASGNLAKGEATVITQRTNGPLSEVFHKGAFRWVQTSALLTEGVEPPKEDPVDQGSLNHGSSSGLDQVNANTKKVVRHIWANFPQIKTMYGWRRDVTPDHPAGRAVDVMLPNYKSNKALGREIADYYRANASEFGISYIIFDQKIWSVARNKEGWRAMSNRGGDTANHLDHVHVNTYDA
ncbi:hypothetical protein [Tessaracoccus antarcticus]|uniref:ARB-07466-like C-terminal domain-containing protein n=1 Tax=Tessaracoccus antarcticus TaxID=2479848 RepID=A0A3M0G8V8_9ACTN|nr:hypothetical protein [Tessaracoccus antarcticus]RMB57489.1 hypothetical protein EAX62_15750 [Tessaracoccus antarcticus]